MKTKTGVSWKIKEPFIGLEPMTYAYFIFWRLKSVTLPLS